MAQVGFFFGTMERILRQRTVVVRRMHRRHAVRDDAHRDDGQESGAGADLLPESRDPAVYDALFRSLKEHLFK